LSAFSETSAFFNQLAQHKERPALQFYNSAGQVTHLSYQAMAHECQRFSAHLASKAGCAELPQRQLIFLLTGNNVPSLVAYLACLQQRHAIMLLDENINSYQLDKLKQAYNPHFIVSAQKESEKEGEQEGDNKEAKITHCHRNEIPLDDQLSLLLSTSGSTGSPKQVALSQANLHSNAQSICAYLPIQSDHTTITTLPMNYSYGLSVINSHLLAGACVFLNQASVVDRAFWQTLETQQINSIAGVPYSWEMLLRLGITKKELPFLHYFTQAGGKLAPKRIQMLNDYAQASNKSFFIMYGQTEATARMAYLAPERAADKSESIGQAIPGGTLQLFNEQGELIKSANQEGELVYSGDNVMLGYAEQQADLAKFTPQTRLATGDLAYFDAQGDFFITGRKKRFIKIHGLRVSLDEVENLLRENQLEAHAVGEDNALRVAITQSSLTAQVNSSRDCVSLLASLLGVHHTTIRCVLVDNLLTTANGKPDYVATDALLIERLSTPKK